MLIRTDPFYELQRFAGNVLGTAAHPATMPVDAWRDGDQFIVEFDVPGVAPESLDVQVERDVLSVRAQRPRPHSEQSEVASERPHGVFSRQLILGDTLDTEHIQADYADGVLRLTLPIAQQAKPRKIAITNGLEQKAIA
jgi:HSP20 family protein